jgi:hypothetical protein
MPKDALFNIRKVALADAKYMTFLSGEIGIPRERYIRKMIELHVAAERARRSEGRQTPGRMVLEVPTHKQVAAAIAAEG